MYIPSLDVLLFGANPSTDCVLYSPGQNGVSSLSLLPSASPIVQFLSFPSASLCPSLSGWLSLSMLHLLPHELAGSEGRGQQPFRIQGRRTACCIFTMSETGLKCVGRGSSHQSAAQTPSTRESEVKKKGQKNNKFLLSFKMYVVLHDREQQWHQIRSFFE